MKRRGVFLAICVVGVLGYYAVQRSAEAEARAEAEAVVAAVQAYRASRGVYPATLEEVGLSTATLKQRWRISYLRGDIDRPMLSYEAQDAWMKLWSYDFSAKKWVPVT